MTYQRTRQTVLRFTSSCVLVGTALMASAQAYTPPDTPVSTAPPIVQTSQGALSGKSIAGVRAYLGIPYAAPPVGELRWQSPQPPASCRGTRDGTAFGQRCAQPLSIVSPESVNEDCLFLNVHVPDDIGRHGKLPVMVWIHGGAFLSGAASDYDMSKLAQKAHAVVVSVNYRVGAFGFFRQPELVAQNISSNLGLQDQQAALRWVQSQIGRFGGDASRVTIFGQSAGGASACLHMVSPQSKGLFHRAIMQSGTCHLLTSTPPAVMQAQSTELGIKLGCAQGPGQLACLRNKPAAEVVRASVPNGNEVRDVDLRWTPVQDGITLTGNPGQQVMQGQFHRVPTMIGTTHDEGRLFVATEYHLALLDVVRQPQIEAYITRIAGGDAAQATRLRGTYTTQAYGSLDLAFSALLTDYYFSCDAMREAEAFSRHVPTYHYEFMDAISAEPADPIMPLGSLHGADLAFLLGSGLSAGGGTILPLTATQQKLADQMIRYWGQFAASGQPNGFLPPYWPRLKAHRASSLKLDSQGLAVFGSAAYRKDHQCGLFDPS